ncbi:MAG TPA: hypothetical protein PKD85_20845 [Saprospiraceae bacterium]|nr:hypothetical protein [Saprospiraceae bacterium]
MKRLKHLSNYELIEISGGSELSDWFYRTCGKIRGYFDCLTFKDCVSSPRWDEHKGCKL